MSNTSQRSSIAPLVTSPVNASSSVRPPSTQNQRTLDARRAFLDSLKVASSEVDTELKSRARTIYANEEATSNQDAELQKQLKQLAKENADTEKWLRQTKQKLAEFDDWGDVGEELEDDMDDLEAMLDILEEEEEKKDKTKDSGKSVKGD